MDRDIQLLPGLWKIVGCQVYIQFKQTLSRKCSLESSPGCVLVYYGLVYQNMQSLTLGKYQ